MQPQLSSFAAGSAVFGSAAWGCGAMASLVASEETESVRRRGSSVTCPICLEPLVDAVQLKPCEHQFCAGCASTFLRMNADTHCAPCPICRSPSELGAVVLAATGENLLEHQLRERRRSLSDDAGGARYFDVAVKTKAVAFGPPRAARHAAGADAQSPSRRTPDLWVIADSCYFSVDADVAGLPRGRYDVFFHFKRVRDFRLDEPVKLAVSRGDAVLLERAANLAKPGRDATKEGRWKMLEVGAVDVAEDGGGFQARMTADRPDWWKSGLLVDCLVVRPAAPPPPRAKKKDCVVS